MKDDAKTKKQLVNELDALRKRVADLESTSIRHKCPADESQLNQKDYQLISGSLSNEEKYRIVANFAYDWEYWMGPDRRLVYISPSSERITGYTPSDFLNNRDLMSNIVHPDDRDIIESHIVECDRESAEACRELEYRIVAKNGNIVWIEHRCQPVYLSDGSYGGRKASNTDVTEKKRIEEFLSESEERYRSFFQNNHATMLIIDPQNGRIMDANPAACRYYGYDIDALRAMYITEINTLGTEQVFEEMARAKAEQRNQFYFSHRLANGEVRPVEVYSGPITLKGKNLLYSIVHDISKRKKAEEEKERLIIELRDALSKIKTLSGMLPICSSCKKIRDDKGYWKQIESYIREHSEAEFSHSICPECVKKLYPDFVDKDK
jgi:PAS domain S-box-containing protein